MVSKERLFQVGDHLEFRLCPRLGVLATLIIFNIDHCDYVGVISIVIRLVVSLLEFSTGMRQRSQHSYFDGLKPIDEIIGQSDGHIITSSAHLTYGNSLFLNSVYHRSECGTDTIAAIAVPEALPKV